MKYIFTGWEDDNYRIATFVLNLQSRDDLNLCLVYSPYHDQQTEDAI